MEPSERSDDMKPFTTSQRLKELMEARGLRQADILRLTNPYCEKYGVKLGKNALSQYVSGKTEPGQEKLTILGLALNVSEAWLMGYDVPMSKKITPASTNQGDGRLSKISELASQLSPEEQDHIICQIEWLLSRR